MLRAGRVSKLAPRFRIGHEKVRGHLCRFQSCCRGVDGHHINACNGKTDLWCHHFFITAAGSASCLTSTRWLHNQDSDNVASRFFAEESRKWKGEFENPAGLDETEQAQEQRARGEGVDLFGAVGGGRWKNWYMPGERTPGEGVEKEEEGMWEGQQGYGFEALDQNQAEEEDHGSRVEGFEAIQSSVSELPEGGKEVSKAADSEHPDRLFYPVPIPEKYKVTRKTKWMSKQLRSATLPEDLHTVLRQWVETMYPRRSDWLDLLEELQKNKKKKDLWFQILEFALQEPSFEADIKDYLRLMLTYYNRNRDNDVERIAEKIKLSGLQPDLAIWTLLIDMHCRTGRPEKAREIFRQVTFYDIELGIVTISSLMKAYCSVGKPQEAYYFLKEMEKKKYPIKIESYLAIIRAFGKLGQPERADNIFRVFMLRQKDLDRKKYFSLLSALMDMYIQVDDLEKAEPIFENMLLGNFRPGDKSFAGLLSLCEKRNLLEKAVSMLLKLECKALRVGIESLTCLIGWFQKLGLIDEGEMVFEEIKRRKEKLPWSTCVAMYKLYVSAGLLDKARNILSFSEEKGIQSSSSGYEQIIHALLDAGHHNEAQIMRKKMLKAGYAVSDEIRMALTKAK